MARDRTITALGKRGIDTADRETGHQVHTWSELWEAIRVEVNGSRSSASSPPPSPASSFAARCLFHEATRVARDSDSLGDLAEMIELPGFRRRLLARFATWTLKEFDSECDTPPQDVEPLEWNLYVIYRRLLARLDLEDEPGRAVWASRALVKARPKPLSRFQNITFLDLDPTNNAQWGLVEHAVRSTGSVRVTLPFESSADRAEIYCAVAPIRDRLLGLGFSEVRVEADVWRPSGLRDVESRLFLDGPISESGGRAEESIRSTAGLAIRGAPQGEAMARIVARDVRRVLAAGATPEEILILFRQWTPQTELVLETLRSWRIPAWGSPSRSIDADSGVAALLGAIRIPAENWEVDSLARLLRHGQLRPDNPGLSPATLALAASALKNSRVFRGGPEVIHRAIQRMASGENRGATATQKSRANKAKETVDWILDTLNRLDRRRPWNGQVDQVLLLANTLGLTWRTSSKQAVDQLRDALEECGDLAARLAPTERDRLWSWSEFAREVARIASETTLESAESPVQGAVRLATVDEARGVGARHVFFTELEEGSFPGRDAVEPFLSLRPGDPPGPSARRAYSREELRFLGILGAAEETITLYHPTTDAKGQHLLYSGFLDELMSHFSSETLSKSHELIARVDPALIDHPDLVGSPSDRRLRAIAHARQHNDPTALGRLLVEQAERKVLDGVIAALGVQKRRAFGSPFGEFDGLLRDGQAILNVGDTFHSEYSFSASQLETYIGCPFQFFAKYVMKLDVLDDRDELAEDFTERGSRIHDLLENVEKLKLEFGDPSSENLAERVALNDVLRIELADASDVELGLRTIEDRRLTRVLNRYRSQLEAYRADSPASPVPYGFEVKFGTQDLSTEENPVYPPLVIENGSGRVVLQGMIDRIDVLETAEGSLFRVIDYKSGAGPTATDVKSGHMLQLPLYAMAVERHVLKNDGHRLLDVGYWGLKKDGYRAIRLDGWLDDQDVLESYVLEIAQKLRDGAFPVNSRKTGCEGFCEYRAICRVRQVRASRKEPGDAIVPAIALKASSPAKKKRAPASKPTPESSSSGGTVRVQADPLAADPGGEEPT